MALVLASILDADWMNLRAEIEAAERAGVHGFSIDVMDGHFAPRITFGPQYLAQIRQWTDLPLEAHLMISNPESQVEPFCDAGADLVTFHLEATERPLDLMQYIHGRGVMAGIAIQTSTPLNAISDDVLRLADVVNVMAVPIGYGGAGADGEATPRLRELRARADSLGRRDLMLEVDGGVKPESTRGFVEAGADLLIIGTGIYHSGDYPSAVATALQGVADGADGRDASGVEKFQACPSRALSGDVIRRQRLDQLREALDIPKRVWDPITSRR